MSEFVKVMKKIDDLLRCGGHFVFFFFASFFDLEAILFFFGLLMVIFCEPNIFSSRQKQNGVLLGHSVVKSSRKQNGGFIKYYWDRADM